MGVVVLSETNYAIKLAAADELAALRTRVSELEAAIERVKQLENNYRADAELKWNQDIGIDKTFIEFADELAAALKKEG